MASSILDYIGTYIKLRNENFSSFRVNGVQLPGGEVVEFTDGVEQKFIGIGDNFGTSGYIRYNPRIEHQTGERRVSSVRSGTYLKKCRLVAYSFTEGTVSETFMTKLVTDLKAVPFIGYRQRPTIIIRASNHSYTDILKEELKKEPSQFGRVTCVAIDFDLRYYADSCESCEVFDQDDLYVKITNSETSEIIARKTPPQSYPVLVFSGIVDNGPPYTNSIVDPG
jgi:hypothetical protein